MHSDFGPPVHFFVPRQAGLEQLPGRSGDVWPWICSNASIPDGRVIWTYYTFLMLNERGFNCNLARNWPEEGIVVSHRDFLPATLRPAARVLLICIKPDRKSHSWAQFHIVQNHDDPLIRSSRKGRAFALPHWPQPSLIPRNRSRGTQVRTAAFIGREINLADPLHEQEWERSLQELGILWRVPARDKWHDYSEIDVTISVRSFSTLPASADPVMCPDNKPPSKLINSWSAGVPAIVGRESAYKSVYRSSLDFLVVDSLPELLATLERLRNNPEMYTDMVQNGLERSREFSVDMIADRWISLFNAEVFPLYEEWRNTNSLSRNLEVWQNFTKYWVRPSNLASAIHGYLGR